MNLNGRYALYCRKDASFAEIPWGGASNDSGVVATAIFSVFAGYFSETLEMIRALLYDTVRRQVFCDPKCMT